MQREWQQVLLIKKLQQYLIISGGIQIPIHGLIEWKAYSLWHAVELLLQQSYCPDDGCRNHMGIAHTYCNKRMHKNIQLRHLVG